MIADACVLRIQLSSCPRNVRARHRRAHLLYYRRDPHESQNAYAARTHERRQSDQKRTRRCVDERALEILQLASGRKEELSYFWILVLQKLWTVYL